MTQPPQYNDEDESVSFELPDLLRPPKDARLWIGGHNTLLRGQLDRLLKDNPRPPTGPLDWAIITPQTQDEALYFTSKVKPRVPPGGTILIMLPQTNRNPHGSEASFKEMAMPFDALGLALSSEPLSANPGLFQVLRLQVR